MEIAKVVGNIVCTKKIKSLEGYKLSVIRPIDPITKKEKFNKERVVLDAVSANFNDIVLVIKEGGSAQMITKDKKNPVHSVIVAIVDDISFNKKYLNK
jgi:microcompartment protein CcmK/EutM